MLRNTRLVRDQETFYIRIQNNLSQSLFLGEQIARWSTVGDREIAVHSCPAVLRGYRVIDSFTVKSPLLQPWPPLQKMWSFPVGISELYTLNY